MTDSRSPEGTDTAPASATPADGSGDWQDLVDGDYVRRYRTALRDSLDARPVADAFESWRRYVRDRHGGVVDDLASDRDDLAGDRDDPVDDHDDSRTEIARSLFVETLAFDFRLRSVLEAFERQFDCSVRRPLGVGSSIPYDPGFESVHDYVCPRIDAADDERSAFVAAANGFARGADPDAVARLHRASVSLSFRRAFGRYDTPTGIAELAVEEALGPFLDDASGDQTSLPTVLDPGCGAGAFLAAATRAMIPGSDPDSDSESDSAPPFDPAPNSATDRDPTDRVRSILDAVRGFDVSPTAVRASRLAMVLAIRSLLAEIAAERSADGTPTFAPRVVLGDAVDAIAADPPLDGRRADALLANPPWLTWDGLTERTKSRWRDGPIADAALDLFDREGADARLGYANDDLSVSYAWACLDRLLRDGGRAAVVLKRDVLTGVAGARARRSTLGERGLEHERIHDFGPLCPFPDVDAGTALFSLRVGDRAADQIAGEADGDGTEAGSDGTGVDRDEIGGDGGVPTTEWRARSDDPDATPSADDGRDRFRSLARMRASLDRSTTRLVPAAPDEPTSPWIRADAERRALGDSAYRIRHGVKDDAKSVYAVDRETIDRHDLEPDYLYPYLKSKHVVKYGLFGYDRQLIPQRKAGEDNEAELRRQAPQTYAYLDAHRDRLTDRGSTWFDDGPFYSLFGLGPYTWADYKVVWCRLGFKPHFAVVSTVTDPLLGEKPVVPGDHCMFVGTDDEREALYLCGLLNSAPYQRCLRDVASGGKSSLSKSTVERLALPAWTGDRTQRRLAELTRTAHDIVPQHVDCSKRAYNRKTIPELASVQAEIDRTAEEFLTARTQHGSDETDRRDRAVRDPDE
ncbi:type I restriction endonuclease subunit M [Halobellus rubicundus]|uniref:Type I restriction endonuclease subunit M n=1 Tax=Halobellus rubicundus TaxID=2996466 RepID=A0ABD5MC79_9EURY